MTREEIEKLLAQGPVALLPVGSVEQHGKHLPLFTDSLVAYDIARIAAEKIHRDCPAIVTPLLPFGLSAEHEDWAGTISIKPATMQHLVEDICRNLGRMGFKKIIFVIGHGGNSHFLDALIFELSREVGAFIITFDWCFSDLGAAIGKYCDSTEADFHAGDVETSIMMHLHPELVRTDKLEKDSPVNFTGAQDFHYVKLDGTHNVLGFPWYTKEITRTGVIGNPCNANEAKGKKVTEIIVDALIKVVKELYEKI